MKDDTLAHLHDLLQAGRDVKTFVAGRTFDDYKADSLLRSAVERKFEIRGVDDRGIGYEWRRIAYNSSAHPL